MSRRKKYEVPIEIIELEPNNYHIILRAKIEQNNIVLLIDTGASKTVFNSSLEGIIEIPKEDYDAEDIKTAGIGEGRIDAALATIECLSINEIKIEKLDVATISLDHINLLYEQFTSVKIDGLIGSDFLYNYEAILNYKKKTLTLYC